MQWRLTPEPQEVLQWTAGGKPQDAFAVYELGRFFAAYPRSSFNVAGAPVSPPSPMVPADEWPPVTVHRFFAGTGSDDGAVHTTIRNRGNASLAVVILDPVPFIFLLIIEYCQ